MESGPTTEASPAHPVGEPAHISCIRCRKRKIKCDKQHPCAKCAHAGVECEFPGGSRLRPISRKHLESLENKVQSLEQFIQKLAASDNSGRHKLLNTAESNQADAQVVSPVTSSTVESTNHVTTNSASQDSGNLILARAREGKLCKQTTRKTARFYGGTSLFQMSINESSPPGTRQVGDESMDTQEQTHLGTSPYSMDNRTQFAFGPRDDTSRQLMAGFFQNVYQYHMVIYREWFLRDYAAGGGPYYSDYLMFSICAVGALISSDASYRPLSDVFAKQAEVLVFNSLNTPDITTLQSLILLGNLEISRGRSSKGWLYCGIAFRLTHEIGLHLDPANWPKSSSECPVDREILRRVYWAAFVADKQLSLYFGRPPALYPHEADVRNTIRIPYPPEWESLLDEYICKGTSAYAFECSPAVVANLTHQVELAKIFHPLIVDVFETRARQVDASVAAAKAQQIHNSFVKWLSTLPQVLQWNQWSKARFPPYVLRLHMLFHTGMIILHRPPRQHLNDDAVTQGEDLELCYHSLSAILSLITHYCKHYRLEHLPLDFVHTLSAAADVILIRKQIEKYSWDENVILKPMNQILSAMEAIQDVRLCVREIRECIVASMNQERGSAQDGVDTHEDIHEPDLVDLLHSGAAPFSGGWYVDENQTTSTSDLGLLVTDDFLNEHYSWEGNNVMPLG